MKKLSGNTILITGGGTGIGRGLAEAFHQLGNRVIITGRRSEPLAETAKASPGMEFRQCDLSDLAGITDFGSKIMADYPDLNGVINNAGIMVSETLLDAPQNLATSDAIVTTNILAPIHLTSILLPHLLKQPDATVMMVSSGLAFVPLARTPTYSASKAAIHSYSMSLRQQLKDTAVGVTEIAPPYVQTELTGKHQATDPLAMPLAEFIAEVMQILTADPSIEEVIVERCKALRHAAEQGTEAEVFARLNGNAH